MQLARIDGTAISTVCHSSLSGWRMAICQPLNDRGEEDGTPVLAIDPHGAGEHQRVILSSDGLATQVCVKDKESPLRYIVIGVIDD